jgi:hypothetical protein
MDKNPATFCLKQGVVKGFKKRLDFCFLQPKAVKKRLLKYKIFTVLKGLYSKLSAFTVEGGPRK